MARVSNQVYKVRFPEKYYCIYNVVPVLLLELWTTLYDLEKAPLPNLKDNQEVYKSESIEIYIDMAKGYQYLIK